MRKIISKWCIATSELLVIFIVSHYYSVQVNRTLVVVAFNMMQNVSSTSEAGLVRSEVEGVISFPRKRLSAFCGDYYNSTSIDEKLGVLGNECFLNGLSFVPNVVFVLVAVPVLISWNKSIFASMHVKTWVRFPHHTIRWLLMFVLIITNLFEVCTVGDTFAMNFLNRLF